MGFTSPFQWTDVAGFAGKMTIYLPSTLIVAFSGVSDNNTCIVAGAQSVLYTFSSSPTASSPITINRAAAGMRTGCYGLNVGLFGENVYGNTTCTPPTIPPSFNSDQFQVTFGLFLDPTANFPSVFPTPYSAQLIVIGKNNPLFWFYGGLDFSSFCLNDLCASGWTLSFTNLITAGSLGFTGYGGTATVTAP